MIKGNKGEWSEFYAFIKILVDKKLIGADDDLQKIESIVFPVLKIIREDSTGKSEYELQENNDVTLLPPSGHKVVVDCSYLKTKVSEIFEAIKTADKTFEVPLAESVFERLQVHSLNAGNSRKEDLVLKIHDHTINREHEIGFSIKSRLGSPATLLNASSATNFTYTVEGLDSGLIKKINGIDTKAKIRDRISAITEAGGRLKFHSVDSEIFEKNLRKIDTVMPEIMAEVLLAYFSDVGADFPTLIRHIETSGTKILNFNLSSEDIAYKIKALLNNSALGMVPASAWDGNLRAHGGVIVVREDGEIVCYHLYNAESFRNYLFNHTRLESPSATRHGYGELYSGNGETFFKLNLQIRFMK
jgi:type II restriction enzyme